MKTTYDNMKKAELVSAALLLDTGMTKSAISKLKMADLRKQLAAWEAAAAPVEDADDAEEQSGSRVPQKYRAKYAEAAQAAGRKAHTVTGKATLNNGDEFALLWEAIFPLEACELADSVVALPDEQPHAARYGHLNPGMVRMNAGNRIRGAIKRGDVKAAKVVKLTKAIIKARPAA